MPERCHCGATRIDQQLGLESTPEQYVERMVEVFREVRRVLAAHGTVWLNLGDSYANPPPSGTAGQWAPGGSNKATNEAIKGQRLVGGTLKASGLKQKDLCGIPWRVAFALQADGWYLRSDIIWAKPNPMPESVTDRPTKAHEYVFLLSKQPRYFFDQEAVREPAEYGFSATKGQWRGGAYVNQTGPQANSERGNGTGTVTPGDGTGGRNIRSVWEIATQPYPEAHFATFPEELARRCIAAGCPEAVCRVCGKARERVVERTPEPRPWTTKYFPDRNDGGNPASVRVQVETLGFTDCDCHDERCPDCGLSGCVSASRKEPGRLWCDGCARHFDRNNYRPGIVLDPFMGSGTVAFVVRKLGRHAVGIDLSAEYLALAARRLQQQSLFALEGNG